MNTVILKHRVDGVVKKVREIEDADIHVDPDNGVRVIIAPPFAICAGDTLEIDYSIVLSD